MSDEQDVKTTDTSAQPAPFIRTYATDAARLGGQSVVPTVAPQTSTVPSGGTPKEPEPVLEPDLPPAVIIPKAPTTNETREEVLARLRAKVESSTSKKVTATPRPESTSREEVLARLKQNATTPPEASVIETPSPIHTYTSDFRDKSKKTGASKISILASQQDASGTREPEALAPVRKSNFAVIGGGLLIVLGLVSVTLAYQFVTKQPIIPTQTVIPSLIFADARAKITGAGRTLQKALVDLNNTSLAEGNVLVAYVAYSTTTEDGTVVEEPANGGALISALGLPAPEIVLRNILPESTVGIVRAGGESHPFFILRVSSFERTFAGMLSWEKSLTDDLALLYPPRASPVAPAPVATTTTSTSTPTVTNQIIARFFPRFSDKVVANRDVRIFTDEQGASVLLYGYRDKETLIIARDEAAFEVLLERLANSKK
jgi:hypothetical protein